MRKKQLKKEIALKRLERQNYMKTRTHICLKHGIIKTSIVILLSFAFVFICSIPSALRFGKSGSVRFQAVRIEAPKEIKDAFGRLRMNVGWIDSQRDDIEKISKALRIGKATSESLGQSGDWLTPWRLRVNVREAVIFWDQIQHIEEKSSSGLRDWQIKEATRLSKFVKQQVGTKYAEVEKFYVTSERIDLALYRIGHHGSDPPITSEAPPL